MQKLIYTFLILFAIFTGPSLCHAENPATEAPEDIARRLQQRYDNMQSLSFNFSQDTSGEMTGRPRKGGGSAIFFKGDDTSKMRWDYSRPDIQVLISDGVTFSMYFENLQQIIVTPAKALEADLTYSFFTGKGDLLRDFYLHPADTNFQNESSQEFKVIKMVPKQPRSQVQDIHLWVSNDSLIRRINIRDHFGTITILNLSNIKPDGLNNIGIQELETLFSFVPPEGTEVINQ
ncbi:MAG: outer membrane lipoprotein carrier protein LolA [Desulfobulbaceae bacterium]|nr:outer membrane lipoprotein carrier protein LolA [Desulfobulbaceae bacterium]